MTRSVTLAGLPRAGANSKPHRYKQKVQKMKDIPKTWVLRWKQFEIFRRKQEQKQNSRRLKKPQWNTRAINTTVEYGPGKTVRIKLNKTWKKAFRSKLLELCQTRAKKSSLDVFNFYVVLAGFDMTNEAGRATTCGRKFKAPWLQTKVHKMKELWKTWVLMGKQVEEFRQKKNKNKILDLSKTPRETHGL